METQNEWDGDEDYYEESDEENSDSNDDLSENNEATKDGAPTDEFSEDPSKLSFMREIATILQSNSEASSSNCLVLNRHMQEKLLFVRDKLVQLLECIKKRYRDNEEKLKVSMQLKSRGVGIRGAYLKGGTFYFKGNMFFKDNNCRNCPNNPDYIKRSEIEKEMFPMDFELRGRHVWSLMDKVSIVKGVKEQVIEYLEHRNNTQITKKKTLQRNISLHTQKLANLLQNVGDDFQIDWHQICIYNLRHRHTASSCKALWDVYLKPSLNRNPWKSEENSKLLEAATRFNFENWASIASEVGNRSDYQCFVQFHTTVCFMTNTKMMKWTKSEDRRLLDTINKYTMNGVINWNAVASRFPNRNKNKCMSRYYYSINPKLSHAPFTPEEDIILLAAIEEYGENFGCIPRALFPNRSCVQLRCRYRNTLMHRNKNNGWSCEDDKKLMDFVAEYGQSSWLKCAEALGNHTRTSCRTRFITITKFLKKNPNASVKDIPRKIRSADNLVTTDNWTEKVIELQQNPNACLKPQKKCRKELQKLRQGLGVTKCGREKKYTIYAQKLGSIQLKIYNFFKYSYNFTLGVDFCSLDLSKSHSVALHKVVCGFHMSPNEPFLRDYTLPNKVAVEFENALMQPNSNIANQTGLVGYHLPPNWSTLMGFRALCVQSAQTKTQTKKVHSTKKENIDAVYLFRQRLRALFYKTALLSRLNPNNIKNVEENLHSKNRLIELCPSEFDENSVAAEDTEEITPKLEIQTQKIGKPKKRPRIEPKTNIPLAKRARECVKQTKIKNEVETTTECVTENFS